VRNVDTPFQRLGKLIGAVVRRPADEDDSL
jgi:hypothetical protein